MFYRNEDEVITAITQVLKPLKNGMKEDAIIRSVKVAPWINAKKEADEFTKPEERDFKNLIKEIRRVELWKVILKLSNDGHTNAEIAKSLQVPYSTVYYYRKKFKARVRPRGHNNDKFKSENGQVVRIKEPHRERKARLEAKKTALQAAEEKRQRKAEKRLTINMVGRMNNGN